jgi:hypothetical protein
MNRSFQTAFAALVAVAALLVGCGAICAGTVSAAVSWVKTNSCPPGYQLDPQNSQQCRPLSQPGPETSMSGCTTAGYNTTGASPTYCVDNQDRDTYGQPALSPPRVGWRPTVHAGYDGERSARRLCSGCAPPGRC